MFWRLRWLFQRRRLEADLVDELALHETLKRKELIDRGMTPEDATLASRRALGSIALAHDRVRDAWQWPRLSDLGH